MKNKPEDKKPEVKKPDAVDTTPSKEDVVVIGPPTPDGAGANVLRLREGRMEAGQIRSLEQGKPIVGEVVTLRPREEAPNVCDVQVEHDATPPKKETNRPAQVATANYRQNWDAIWKRQDPKQLPN